ncbi:hypothetical protein HNY73_017178 [Argiope bruennichi]|uniref:Uncharacterized protein n=1 Tax=Argiope bruennichi TaxID=94029 RepID=A0A8T0EM23_ARGBR|nr:hypothetical protein HNY73_017178 [Argiope bruennichi]
MCQNIHSIVAPILYASKDGSQREAIIQVTLQASKTSYRHAAAMFFSHFAYITQASEPTTIPQLSRKHFPRHQHKRNSTAFTDITRATSTSAIPQLIHSAHTFNPIGFQKFPTSFPIRHQNHKPETAEHYIQTPLTSLMHFFSQTHSGKRSVLDHYCQISHITLC